jgi:hypothetical protein
LFYPLVVEGFFMIPLMSEKGIRKLEGGGKCRMMNKK